MCQFSACVASESTSRCAKCVPLAVRQASREARGSNTLPCTVCCSVALERNWTILDRFGATANMYMSYATDARFNDLELFFRGDGVHWQWGVLREMNRMLLQLLEQYWKPKVLEDEH